MKAKEGRRGDAGREFAQWKPPARTRTSSMPRRTYESERAIRNAADEAVAKACPGQDIDFEAARNSELEEFRPTQRSALFHRQMRAREREGR